MYNFYVHIYRASNFSLGEYKLVFLRYISTYIYTKRKHQTLRINQRFFFSFFFSRRSSEHGLIITASTTLWLGSAVYVICRNDFCLFLDERRKEAIIFSWRLWSPKGFYFDVSYRRRRPRLWRLFFTLKKFYGKSLNFRIHQLILNSLSKV